MTKVITFVPDIQAFIADLQTNYPQYITEDENGVHYTPLHEVRAKNTHGSLAICLLDDEALQAIESSNTIVNKGWYPDVLNDADYKAVYPYDVPIVFTDEDSIERTYYRPEKIGEIA